MVHLHEAKAWDIARFIFSLGKSQQCLQYNNHFQEIQRPRVISTPSYPPSFSLKPIVDPRPRPAAILRSGGLLLHRGAEDQHVEGGAGLGQPPHLHLRPLAARGNGEL